MAHKGSPPATRQMMAKNKAAAAEKARHAVPLQEVAKLDANQLLQDWKQAGMAPTEQRSQIRLMLATSSPLIVRMAELVGDPKKGNGAIRDDDDRREAIQQVVKMGRLLGEEFRFFEKRVARAIGMGVTEIRALVLRKKKKGDEEDDEGEPIYTAGGWIQGHLVELLYDQERMRTAFAVRKPNGEIEEYLERIVIEGKKYVPVPPNSTIVKRVVLLPNCMGEQLQDHELLAVIQNHHYKYFDFGSDAFFQEITPLWVMFTYLYDGFREVSYLRGLGDYGTGKTRLLKTVGKICYRPVYMSGGSSAASIFHLLDFYRGTLVLNEADFGESDEASIIAKILNGGTERDEGITRMRKDMTGNFEVESYNVFGPKLIVTRKDFDDRAIASRCLTMEMAPFMPHPRIPQSLPSEFDTEALQIRNLLTTWRLHNARQDFTVDQKEADRSLEPRLNQVTMSLLSTVRSQEMKDKIHAFLRDYNERTRADRKESKTARVIEGLVLANAWGPVSDHPSDEKRVYLKDVAAAVNNLMDAMRHKMGEDQEEEEPQQTKWGKKRSGKMTSRSVSGILKSVCQLRVREVTDGMDDYRGTNEVVWDEDRIKALCERWGVPWKDRGSEKRPMDPVSASPGLKKERDEWNSMHLPEEPGDEK